MVPLRSGLLVCLVFCCCNVYSAILPFIKSIASRLKIPALIPKCWRLLWWEWCCWPWFCPLECIEWALFELMRWLAARGRTCWRWWRGLWLCSVELIEWVEFRLLRRLAMRGNRRWDRWLLIDWCCLLSTGRSSVCRYISLIVVDEGVLASGGQMWLSRMVGME